jgi:hypothetical protein
LIHSRRFPVLEKFILMLCRPFDYQAEHPGRKLPFQDAEGRYFDGRSLVSVPRMEMRGIMFVEEHRDDDSEEPAYFRHSDLLAAVSDVFFSKGFRVSLPWGNLGAQAYLRSPREKDGRQVAISRSRRRTRIIHLFHRFCPRFLDPLVLENLLIHRRMNKVRDFGFSHDSRFGVAPCGRRNSPSNDPLLHCGERSG